MSADDKFFQFPIGALRMRKPIDTVTVGEMQRRLEDIISYCMVEVGTSICATKSIEIIEAMSARVAASLGIGDKTLSKKQSMLFCGAEQLGVVFGSPPNACAHFDAHGDLLRLVGTSGRQLCRLRSNLLWEAKAGEDWTWRELATLCAVYAGIGRYQRAKLTYDRIGAMALGFNGQRERDAAGAKGNQLSYKQTLRTVHQLRDRSLFVMASPNRRHVFYSHRMTMDELIVNLATTAPEKKISAAAVTELIRQKQAELEAKRAAI